MSNNILIVDDERDIRESLSGILEDEGFNVIKANNDINCFKKIKTDNPDVIILDIWLEGSELNGIDILNKLHNEHCDIPIIMITGHGDIKTSIKAIKMGAYDFLEKPFDFDKLIMIIGRALELNELKKNNKKLIVENELHEDGFLIGESMKSLKEEIDVISGSNSRVFITGETGAGKASVARLIHEKSNRRNSSFIMINCASMNDKLLEEKLFGSKDMEGLIEKAQGGTLFLNEIADMSLEIQAKISSFILQEKFSKIDSDIILESNCRVICSTAKDIEKLVEKGAFRKDLYYRLNVVPLYVPSLQERKEDIPLLSKYFIEQYCLEHNLIPKKISEEVMLLLKRYDWNGNIVQLKNACDSIIITNASNNKKEIKKDMLPSYLLNAYKSSSVNVNNTSVQFLNKNLREARSVFEKNYIEDQLDRFRWNISKTAEFIGMERSALHKKMNSLGIKSKK
ncbi:MAG: sigma-54 dependent transcriptional regulator [Alphaproteobacteria bacterium]|nr:sigma-54 dependent transcriptional regulator [Alphaproteobacteria bacterium]